MFEDLGETTLEHLKKDADKFTKDDYLKLIKARFEHHNQDEKDKYDILIFIFDQLGVTKEEYSKIIEKFLIRNLRQEVDQLSTFLAKKFICGKQFDINVNKLVKPTLEGLLNGSKNISEFDKMNSYVNLTDEFIHYLKIHDADFTTLEASILLEKFDTDFLNFEIDFKIAPRQFMMKIIQRDVKCLKCSLRNGLKKCLEKKPKKPRKTKANVSKKQSK